MKVVVLWCLIAVILVVASEPVSITAYAAVDSSSDSKAIGPKECALGSSYWCQDLLSAKKCGAVKHCIQIVWEHETQEPDSSDICETCKAMVKEARDELLSNETQDLIRAVLDGTCRIYFPIKELANECIKLVDEFIPEFIDMLASRMDPQTVCKTAWLCNSNKFKQIVEDIQLVQVSDAKGTITVADACQDCKAFVTDAIAKIKTMSKNDFVQKLLKGCDMLQGFMREGCRMAVTENIDTIYTYVTTKLEPTEFCSLAAMCIDGLPPSVAKLPPVNGIYFRKVPVGGPECDFCEQLITRLKEQILANATKEEVREVFESLCARLGAYEKECDNFLDQYFDEIYTFLTEELDPEQVCAALGLCTQTKPFSKVHKKPHFTGDDERSSVEWNPKQDAVNIDDKGQSGIKVETKFPLSKPSLKFPTPANSCGVQDKMQCVICEFALREVQTILKDKRSEDEIKNAIDQVCALLPKTISEECTAFIDEYGSAIMVMLSQELDPSEVCTELDLCSGGGRQPIPIEDPPVNTMARIVKTSDDAKSAANSQQLPLERMFPFAVHGSTESQTCVYCEYGMGLLHSLLNANGTKEAILKGLHDVCHEMPDKWKMSCDQLVYEYADAFLTMLQLENLPQLCSVMSFCQSRAGLASAETAAAATRQAILDANSDTCEVCERTVEMLSKLLNDPNVERGISEALKMSCAYVPASMKEKCTQIIEVYGPFMVKMIGELADSKVVCQSIELCPQPSGQVKLIGGDKCSLGPKYACKSKLHAKACNSVEHCQKYVWKK